MLAMLLESMGRKKVGQRYDEALMAVFDPLHTRFGTGAVRFGAGNIGGPTAKTPVARPR